VESCPNGAIAIKIVDVSEVLDDAQGDAFLPGAPSPGITGPTTTYKTQRSLPRNVLPANFYDVRPAAKHMPLVVMLVLTQLSVGAYVVDALLNARGHSSVSSALGRAHSLIALGLGLLALGAATLHLGRPLYAFRAFIGLRTSWMSREIIAIGVFVKIAVIHALSFWKPELFTWVGITRLLGVSMDRIQDWLSVITAAVGVLAAACSVMIYVATKRKWWSGSTTTLKFFGTAGILGLSTMTATTSVTARITGSQDLGGTFRVLLAWLLGVSAAKLIYELGMFRHLLDKQQGDLKRTALLMTRDLKEVTIWRFILGTIGGIILPGLILLSLSPPASTAAIAITCLSTLFMLGGELLERTLFFTAVSAPRMPGAIGK
jgi:DMSO reductase anchor subunit